MSAPRGAERDREGRRYGEREEIGRQTHRQVRTAGRRRRGAPERWAGLPGAWGVGEREKTGRERERQIGERERETEEGGAERVGSKQRLKDFLIIVEFKHPTDRLNVNRPFLSLFSL